MDGKRARTAGHGGIGGASGEAPRSPKRQRSAGASGAAAGGALGLSTRRKPAGSAGEQVDAFVGRCAAWQGELGALSALLEAQVAKVEEQQVAQVLRAVVGGVEARAATERLEEAEMERKWGELKQRNADAFARKALEDRQALHEFEAIERQLLDDRVLELETQLQQKRANEKEKEVELAELRASHEEMLGASALEQSEERQKLLEERDALLKFKDEARQKMRRQAQKNSKLNDEVLGLKFQNQDLLDECKTLRKEKESLVDECGQMKSEMERLAEKLKLVEEASSRTDQQTAKVDDMLKRAQEEAATKTLAITKFQGDKAALEEKLAAVTAQYNELVQAQAAKSASSTFSPDRRRSPSARPTPSPSRKRRREDFSANGVEQLSASPGGVSPITLKRQATEKELIQGFFQRYYSVAERKCSALLHEVETLKTETMARREQAREFHDVLRVCAQAEGLEATTRASLEKVVKALERGLP